MLLPCPSQKSTKRDSVKVKFKRCLNLRWLSISSRLIELPMSYEVSFFSLHLHLPLLCPPSLPPPYLDIQMVLTFTSSQSLIQCLMLSEAFPSHLISDCICPFIYILSPFPCFFFSFSTFITIKNIQARHGGS